DARACDRVARLAGGALAAMTRAVAGTDRPTAAEVGSGVGQRHALAVGRAGAPADGEGKVAARAQTLESPGSDGDRPATVTAEVRAPRVGEPGAAGGYAAITRVRLTRRHAAGPAAGEADRFDVAAIAPLSNLAHPVAAGRQRGGECADDGVHQIVDRAFDRR